MITSDDMAKAVTVRIAANGTAATIFPGSWWFNRGPDNPAGYPYLIFELKAQRKMIWSGSVYGQEWELRCRAYADDQTKTVGVEQLLETLFGTDAANVAMRASTFRTAADGIEHCLPAEQSESYAPDLRGGKDVLVGAATYSILIRGTKAAA